MKKIATVTIATAGIATVGFAHHDAHAAENNVITLMTQLHIATLIQLINKVTIITHGKVIGVLIV